MGFPRAQRVAEEIKREIAQIIRDEVKDPRIGFVTVTGVDVSGDLKYAKVFISVYGKEEQTKDTFIGLNKANGFIKREISKRIKLRIAPEIIFKLDESLEYGSNIVDLLNKVRKEGEQNHE